jgi:hypothetical protein
MVSNEVLYYFDGVGIIHPPWAMSCFPPSLPSAIPSGDPQHVDEPGVDSKLVNQSPSPLRERGWGEVGLDCLCFTAIKIVFSVYDPISLAS